jgi:hypothetical protein
MVHDDTVLDEQDTLREQEIEAERKLAKQHHKCHNCLWATWINDLKVMCAFPTCIKK